MSLAKVQGESKTTITKADDYQLIHDDIVSVEPVPVELRWNMTDKEFDKYERITSRHLKSNKEFRDESLRRFLRRKNILVYSLEDVGRLLKYREKDQAYFSFLIESERNKEMYKSSTRAQFGGLLISEKVFHGFIPLRIVTRINFILRKFPELYCFISANKNCPETFVAVTFGQDSDVFVIDMWDKDGSDIIAKREG